MSAARPKRYWLGRIAALLLGLVLLVAAWAKLLDPVAFAEQIAQEGLDFLLPGRLVALAAIGLEIGLGTALVLGVRRRWLLVATGALLVLFLFLTGRAYWLWSHGLLDESAACGCFGNLVERTPAEAFWQDAAGLVPLYLLSFVGRRRGAAERSWRLAVAVAVAVAGVLFAWAAPSLPLDDLATRLAPGTELGSICAGGSSESERICLDVLVPALAEGRHWVVIDELEDEKLLGAIDGLNGLATGGAVDGVWLLSADPPEAQQAFFWRVGPAFEVREVPLSLIRPLYRTTPRSFLVEDGMVTETVSGLPPAAREPQATRG